MRFDEAKALADSRHDRVIVDRVSYARGWLERDKTAKVEEAAALDVAAKYRAFYVVNKRAGYIPTLADIQSEKEEVKREIAAKLAERGSDGR